MSRRTAAILTIGSELTEGLRVDTNSAEIARELGRCGFTVDVLESVGDNVEQASRSISRLTAEHDLVVTTGGLGPTHDDVTRQATAHALGVELVRDQRLEQILQLAAARHLDPEAAQQVLVQADVLPGAEVIDATTGTAPGLIVRAPKGGLLALLPGPPAEMRPMLAVLTRRFLETRAEPVQFGVTGMGESAAQIAASRALGDAPGVRLTVLARPGDVQVILIDDGAGASGLAAVSGAVRAALGDACYAEDGSSLAETVVKLATHAGMTFATAESCTGGLLAGAVTDVPGASACFRGGIVAYHDDIKRELLGVGQSLLTRDGAVSESVALAMAVGARERSASDVAVSVTGIAGPEGGTAEKPVGLVWFGIAGPTRAAAFERRFSPNGRMAIRQSAIAFALNLLRQEISSP